MKYQPYLEIINLKSEIKKYKKLCKGKSKKFFYYTDWEKYIFEKFSQLDSTEKINNFKHYLIREKRIDKNIKSYYVTLMVFFLTTAINRLNVSFTIPIFIVFMFVIIFEITIQTDENDIEYCFYCDLLEILQKLEEKEES